MARPQKQGLDYFSLDVDFFEDIKIRKIKKDCGAGSISILVCLLCNIYKDCGYYMGWNDDEIFAIAETVGVAESVVKEAVNKALQVGFFNKNLYDTYKILTSKGIQKRFLFVVKTSKLKKDAIIPKFNLSINSEEIPVNTEEMPITSEVIAINTEKSTQRKEKKSKVKKSKERENISLSLSQQKFAEAFPNKAIDCDFDDSRFNCTLLITKIRESDFLCRCNNLGLNWCLEHYNNIIADKHKDYSPPKEINQGIIKHDYSPGELSNLISDLDKVVF